MKQSWEFSILNFHQIAKTRKLTEKVMSQMFIAVFSWQTWAHRNICNLSFSPKWVQVGHRRWGGQHLPLLGKFPEGWMRWWSLWHSAWSIWDICQGLGCTPLTKLVTLVAASGNHLSAQRQKVWDPGTVLPLELLGISLLRLDLCGETEVHAKVSIINREWVFFY